MAGNIELAVVGKVLTGELLFSYLIGGKKTGRADGKPEKQNNETNAN